MPRNGENIYKRKDGRWEGRFIKEYGVNRKALYGYVYGKTYNEVRQKLRKAQVKELSPPLPSNQSATTYNDLLKLWRHRYRSMSKNPLTQGIISLSRRTFLPRSENTILKKSEHR